MYLKKTPPRRRRPGLLGFGDFTDSDQCSTIPSGDPYRKPGNYCATPDGGITTFNSDGSTYRQPGSVDPDPAHPAGSGGGGGGGVLDSILKSFFPAPVMTPVMAPSSGGLSTTTALMIGGGVLLVAVLLSRK
jgi:hypothetical protein